MLATGSDDHTVKVWQREDADLKLLHKLDDHGGAVTCVRFGAQTDRPLLLASASLDCTVKLWDAESGRCIRTFNEHSFPVIALEFAPSADLIASIAYDRLHVWSTRVRFALRIAA
jgi:WD40 repeat protein